MDCYYTGRKRIGINKPTHLEYNEQYSYDIHYSVPTTRSEPLPIPGVVSLKLLGGKLA